MNQMIEGLMAMTIVIACFLFVAWIIWMVSRQRRERHQRDIDLKSRMLEKFGTSEEFVQFMQTDAGRKFLEPAQAKAEKSLHGRVASSLSSGVVLVLLGLAFFSLSWLTGSSALVFPGAIMSAIGVGLVLSAIIYWKFVPACSEGSE